MGQGGLRGKGIRQGMVRKMISCFKENIEFDLKLKATDQSAAIKSLEIRESLSFLRSNKQRMNGQFEIKQFKLQYQLVNSPRSSRYIFSASEFVWPSKHSIVDYQFRYSQDIHV